MCTLANCPDISLRHSHGGRPPISINKQLLIFLWFLGTQECARSILDRFNVTKSLVLIPCRRVLDAIKNNLAEHLIKWPNGRRAVKVMKGFEEHKRVPAVIGAIDGSSRVPRELQQQKRFPFHHRITSLL